MDYIICENGDIYGMHRGKISQRKNVDGYMLATVGKLPIRTTMRVHRLVAEAFIENPLNLPEVNHKDFNRSNNNASNLEWCTHLTNVRYSVDLHEGAYNQHAGTNNGRSILREEDVLKIRECYASGKYNIAELARLYGRGWQTINHIIKRTTWKHI